MTRKDYVKIAEAIKRSLDDAISSPSMDSVPNLAIGSVMRVATNVADVLAADNPRFDRSRFMSACGF